MANGSFASRESGMELGPRASAEAAGLGALADAVRGVIQRHASGALSSSALRADLSSVVREARRDGASIEQVLVMLKRQWRELPQAHGDQATRSDSNRRLERAVTFAIETYYEP